MKNLPMPFIIPYGCRLKITQPYGNTSLNQWYHDNNINIPSHNGTDVVLINSLGQEDAELTYGTRVITPSLNWKIVKVTFDTPMSTKGNGVTLESPEFQEDGRTMKLQIVVWHCSEVLSLQGELPSKTKVASVGNSGLCNPAPSIYFPYAGAHGHLMLFEYEKLNGYWTLLNNNNGLGGAVDFMSRFNINNLIYGPNTGVLEDLPPVVWAVEQLQKLFNLFFKR